jgi:hypothetical protein
MKKRILAKYDDEMDDSSLVCLGLIIEIPVTDRIFGPRVSDLARHAQLSQSRDRSKSRLQRP